MRIYLAALTHNHRRVANEAMPLVPGYLKVFLEQALGSEVSCRIFVYPDKLMEGLCKARPDLLMVSNYVWNEALSLHALGAAKRVAPEIVTIMGGPNFSLNPLRREHFLRSSSSVDAVILGEAEIATLRLAQALIRSGKAKSGLEDPSLSFLCRIRDDGVFQEGFQAPVIEDLNRIPSPWLSGDLDEFFDGVLAPLLETTRGCSGRCLYCVQGAGQGQKIRQFALERVEEELRFIARRISERSAGQGYLALADPEFGVHAKDLQVADCLLEQRQRYGWPRFMDATTGNRRRDAVLRIMERLKDCLTMYSSVQTLNPTVARTIRRRNHHPLTIAADQRAAKARGIRTLSETILALPGEGYESHKHGLFDLLDAGFKQLVNYQCMLLKGSDLETVESRRRFELSTRHRALPRCSGIYDGERVIETEEIIVETPQLPFEDYLKARRLHLVLFVFLSGGWFDPVFEFVRSRGTDPRRVLEHLAERGLPAHGAVSEWMGCFLTETRGELFETRDSCRRFYSDPVQFERLQSGEIGGNLMFKYLATGIFRIWPQLVAHVVETVRELLPLRREDETLLADLETYVRNRIVHESDAEAFCAPQSLEFAYDIPAWAAGGFDGAPGCFLAGRRLLYEAALNPERLQTLRHARALYGTDLAGITKWVARTRRSDFEKDFTPYAEVNPG